MPRRRTFEVDGMAALEKKLSDLSPAIKDALRAAVKEEVAETADDMRRHAARGNPPTKPVTLVQGIQEEIGKDGLSGAAVATARHSTFVEHGTEDTPEQPFAQPAAERSRRRFEDTVRKHVDGTLKGLTK